MKKLFFILLSLFVLLGTFSSALAYVSASSNYRLEKDSINTGGSDFSSSASYFVSDTLGEFISGLNNGSGGNASSGYRYMEPDPVVTVVLGCTDSRASNYNALATQNDGSCTYPPSGCVGVCGNIGCTDPKATNYNPSAAQDDGSCVYSEAIPNVRNFQAVYQPEPKNVLLTWVNPVQEFKSIRIVRLRDSIPTGPQDGQLIYTGRGEEALDFDVVSGAHYYYVAFVRGLNNKYSSGVVANVRIPDEEIPPECTGPDCNEEEGCSGSNCGGIFGSLPVSTSSTPFLQREWNLRFIQPEERAKAFDWRGMVRLAGEKPITILFTPNISLDYLKTIGVTLTDPQDKTKNFSFLMHRSAKGLSYEATLSPLIRPGTYPIDIYIINYSDQTIQHIKGKLVIPSPGVFWAETLIAQLAPFVVAGGLAIGFLPTLYDLLLTLLRFIGYFFGRRRHDKPWGTVYDSVTKRPLDPVYVTALQKDTEGKLKEVASAITDIDGRFSFFLPAGTYYLKADKTHYKFPSEKLAGKTSDEIYEDLYFGAPIVVTGEEIINLNLPMDSVDFDWNEFAKTKTNFFHFYNRRMVWLNRLYNFFFGLGFIVSAYILLLNPALINFIIVFLYVGVLLFNKFWRDKRKPLQITKEGTGEPLSFAILRVFIPGLNQQIKNVVADKFGRFYLLVRPGVYYYTIEEKQLDGSYLKTYQSNPVNFSKGILTRDISVK